MQIAGDPFLPGSRAGGDEARAGVALEHPQRCSLPDRGWGTFHCTCWSKPSTHPGEISVYMRRMRDENVRVQASNSNGSNGGSQHLPPPHPPADPLTSPSRTVSQASNSRAPPDSLHFVTILHTLNPPDIGSSIFILAPPHILLALST